MAVAQLNAAMEANRIASETNEKFRDREGRVSAQLKHFGDALRASLTKMSDQPSDLIIFVDSADRLFLELEIPRTLRVILTKPYLNERALTLINRLTGESAKTTNTSRAIS